MSLGDPPLSPTPRNCASIAIHFVLNELSGGNSTKPDVSPSEIIRGVKGRLQSLIRSSVPKAFQRNGCKIDQSPEDIALGFLNSGAIALGMKPQFKFGYYAGTTGEYDLGAV